MLENYNLIKNFCKTHDLKKLHILLNKILRLNDKRNFFLYILSQDFYFQKIKRFSENDKILIKKNLFTIIKKLIYCFFALTKSRKNKKFKYFLFYSISNEIVRDKLTNRYKEAFFKKIDKKKFCIKYLISKTPKKFWNFTYEYPVNFEFLYLNFKSKLKYFFLSRKYKSKETKFLVTETFFKYKQYKYWKKFFKKNKLESIFFIDKISNISIILAANELKIPCYEIQHGSPSKGKEIDIFSYRFNDKIYNGMSWNSHYKPDHFLCFGEFWKKNIDTSHFSKKITNIGININDIKIHQKKNNEILILSDLSEFDKIKKLINLLYKNKKNVIKIRFHPMISILPYQMKFFLEKNNIRYSLGQSVSINNDLNNVNKVIGSNSTLLFQLFERDYNVYFFEKEIIPKKYLIKDKNFFNFVKLNKKYKKQFFYPNKNKIPV